MSLKRDIFINTVVQSLVRVVMLALTLVSLKLLTNYLGVTGVGNYNTITTYLNLFLVVAELGLFSVTVREVAKAPEKEPSIMSNVLAIRILVSLLTAIIAVLLVFFTQYSDEIKYGVLVASGFLFLNLLASVYDMVLQYRLKMQFSALAELISKMVAVIALVIIIYFRGNFLWVASTISLSGLLIWLCKWWFASRYINFKPRYEKEIVSWILKTAWPIGLVLIVNNLFFKLDTLMLFVIKGAAAVGIYSVSFKVLEVTAFIGSYFASALKPSLAQAINDRAEMSNIVNRALEIMLIIALPIAAGGAIYSKEIIIFLSNADFSLGAWALMVLSLALPLMYFDLILSEILIARDERRKLIGVSIAVLSFNFIANLIAIPIYSYNGAAVTTLLTEILFLLLNWRLISPYIDLKFNRSMLTRTLAGIVLATLCVWLFKLTGLHFIIGLFLLVAVYAIAMDQMKVMQLKTIKSILFK